MIKDKKLIIYGVGSFAEYVEYIFENDSPYEVIGFCVENSILKELPKNPFKKNLISFEEIQKNYPPEDYQLFIAVGNNIVRKRIFKNAKALGYTLAKFISSKTIYWENLIFGENTFIDEGSKIHPFVEIGDNCIIMYSTVGHHTEIGDNNLLSVCTLGGGVKIGNDCFLGMNSTIKQNVTIGNKNIIGMGCVISENTTPNAVFSSKGTIRRNINYEKVSNRFLK